MMAAFFSLLVPLFSWASPPVCFDGYYDLGRQAAAIGLECLADDAEAARLVFCKREVLLQKGECTGARLPIRCVWEEGASRWKCEERGVYPFVAWIQKRSDSSITYKFKSSFNEGELEGRRVQQP
jgi:hypothetical protein